MIHNGPQKNKVENTNNDAPQYSHTPTSKFLGTALGALGEQVLFHPIDTTAKTSMAKNLSVFPWLNSLIKEEGIFGTTKKLYRGFVLGYVKKAPLRVYKYGVQDELAARFKVHYGNQADSTFGSYGHVALQSLAGGVTGAFEPILFQWIDTLQVRKQVLGEPISIKSAQNLGIKGLYKGALVTGFGRNTFGAAGLFGGSEFANQLMDNQDHHNDAKNLMAKWSGAFLSLVLSQPGDVIKTKMQVEQLQFLTALRNISFKQLFTSGLAPRLFMSAKVGTGFLLIEKSMKLAKDLFGEEIPRQDASPIVCEDIFDSKPAMLNQFDRKKSDCRVTDETSIDQDKEMKELSEKIKKIKI